MDQTLFILSCPHLELGLMWQSLGLKKKFNRKRIIVVHLVACQIWVLDECTL